MPNAYTEDQLVEQPAIGLFAELGWTAVSALEETFGASGPLLRGSKGKEVQVARQRAVPERWTPAVSRVNVTPAVGVCPAFEDFKMR